MIAGTFGLAPGTRVETREQFAQTFLAAPIIAGRLETAGDHLAVHLAANPDILPGSVLVRAQTTCDVDLDAELGTVAAADLVAKAASGRDGARGDQARPSSAGAPQTVAALDARSSLFPTTARGVLLFWLTLVGSTVLILSVGFWLLFRRMQASVGRVASVVPLSLENTNKGSQVVVITSGSVTRSSCDPAPDVQLQARCRVHSHSGQLQWHR